MVFILEIKIGKKHVRNVGDQELASIFFVSLDLDILGSAFLKSSRHQASIFVRLFIPQE